MKNTWNITAIIAVAVFAVFTIIFCSPFHLIADHFKEKPPIVAAETREFGDGTISFSLYVTQADGTIVEYLIHTSQSTVGAATRALGLIEFEETFRGQQPVSVDGMTTGADTRSYWAIYINHKFVNVQLDDVFIFPETVYELRYDKY